MAGIVKTRDQRTGQDNLVLEPTGSGAWIPSEDINECDIMEGNSVIMLTLETDDRHGVKERFLDFVSRKQNRIMFPE